MTIQLPHEPTRIVVVGSLNVDAVVRVPRFPQPGETLIGQSHDLHPGGKGANQAYAVAKLAGADPSVAVSMLGQVGGDSYGPWLKDNLARVGVDVQGVGIDTEVSSGVAAITIDGAGQNHIVIVPGANGSFLRERLRPHEAALRAADVVLLQLEVPLATVERAAAVAREAGATVILDPAPAHPLSAALLGLCDYVTPNENELRMLLGRLPEDTPLSLAAALEGARALQAQGARNVVVKLGAAGALCLTESEHHHFPPFTVDAVDTTAAGDAWNAGFALLLARGVPLAAAGRFANAVAACAVSKRGAQPSMPEAAEALALLSQGP